MQLRSAPMHTCVRKKAMIVWHVSQYAFGQLLDAAKAKTRQRHA